MQTNSRRFEKLTLFALVAIFALTVYYWDFVHKAFQRTHNTLGQTNVHAPTADLFLWCSVALIFYFGSRFWTYVGPKVFELSAEKSAIWSVRLQVFRVLSTFTFLGLTLYTIQTNVPDFIDKLPWP